MPSVIMISSEINTESCHNYYLYFGREGLETAPLSID